MGDDAVSPHDGDAVSTDGAHTEPPDEGFLAGSDASVDESQGTEQKEAIPEVSPSLVLRAISRSYVQGDSRLEILQDAALAIWPAQAVALVAPSGTGKSTLLHIAGLLEKPDAGEVLIRGAPTVGLSDELRTKTRRLNIGFVYQFHHLLSEFTALENVMLPHLLRGLARQESENRARELLAWLGLGARLSHRPAELSGGEQQRVAIARAIANAPHILLADEPTGNLDPVTADYVFGTLLSLVRALGLSALIATHNIELAKRMDRRVTLHLGKVVELT